MGLLVLGEEFFFLGGDDLGEVIHLFNHMLSTVKSTQVGIVDAILEVQEQETVRSDRPNTVYSVIGLLS